MADDKQNDDELKKLLDQGKDGDSDDKGGGKKPSQSAGGSVG